MSRFQGAPATPRKMHSTAAALMLGGVMWGIVAAGCDNNPFSHVAVEGKISYDDGSLIPAERIRVWFTSQTPPIDEQTHPRPASASVNLEDGSLESFTTYKYGDGLIRGKHKVSIDATPVELVPEEYRSAATTPLVIDTADSPLEIKLPTP